jgi:hypothetical protein
MRGLWIVRLNAACRAAGISYSRFIEGLKAANISSTARSLRHRDRRRVAFAGLVKQAQDALKAKAAAKKLLKTRAQPARLRPRHGVLSIPEGRASRSPSFFGPTFFFICTCLSEPRI